MSELACDGEQSIEETLDIAKKYLRREIFCKPGDDVIYAVMAIDAALTEIERLKNEKEH